MAVIRKLSPEIVGQIAAGEVVERPASAVKELVENSIDAGAKNITVELREGGIQYLRVSDNGKGIPAEQIRMAFERHATSKISEAGDLFDLHTLGFRGEALASIAAVSKVTCTTRTQEADFGTRAVVEAGEFVDIRQAASPVGTTIVAQDLFYNTPVRLKFLKKPAAEASMVSDYMLRLILSHPEVAFRFVSQGKTIYHSMGDGKIESALYAIYGRETFQQMRKVSGHMNGVLVSGYVGTGDLSRGNRQQQSFFVNGRYFRSGLLSRALEKGCEGRVMIGRFPMCALFLEMPRQQVDVNVHPNKLEVRFQNEAAVAAAVETLVRESMHSDSLGGKLSFASAASVSEQENASAKSGFTVVQLNGNASSEFPVRQAVSTEETAVQEPRKTPETVREVLPPKDVKTFSGASSLSGLPKVEPIVVSAAPARHVLSDSISSLRQAQEYTAQAEEKRPNASQTATIASANPVSPKPLVAKQPALPQTEAKKETLQSEDIQSSVVIASMQTEPQKELPTVPKKTADEPSPVQMVIEPVAEMETPLRLVGILFDTYWLFESGDRVLLVDQHAAHERILYDQMMARFEKEQVCQTLLAPQLIRLTPFDMTLVSEFQPVLAEAGFEVVPFDDTSVALHAIPTFFGENESPRELLMEALQEWQAGRGQVTQERLRKRVAQMACKRAIKGGDKLSETEINGFLREMLKCESMPTCPHGRPIITEITRYALEKRFKRVQ